MAFRKLFDRTPPRSVAELRVDEDVRGLVRALADPSPTVVGDAARALGSLHLHGGGTSPQEAAAAGPALLAAFARLQAELRALVAPHQVIERGDRSTAQWAIVDALGTIRSADAAPLLLGLVEDRQADEHLRGRAASALGRIGGDARADLLSGVLEADDTPTELAEGAVEGLLAAGEPGERAIAHVLADPDRRALVSTVERVLEREAGGPFAPVAERFLAARAAEAAWQASERASWEAALVAKRVAAFPRAARLASSLGHPEWTAGEDRIDAPGPGAYAEAVATCRALDLHVEEVEGNPTVRVLRNADDFGREETAEVTTWDLTATVWFEGSPITVTGGTRVQRVDL